MFLHHRRSLFGVGYMPENDLADIRTDNHITKAHLAARQVCFHTYG